MPEIATLESLEQLKVRQRAVRTFTDQPVDDALVERLIDAATRAPSAKNVQLLRFIVVRDRALKQQISRLFEQSSEVVPGGPTPWEEVPVLIFVVSDDPFGASPTGALALAGSVYPGIQNLLLAAQAAGLGSVLTTSRGKLKEPEIKKMLNLPDDFQIHAVLPIGYPAVKLGKNKRKPVGEVAFRDRFGEAW
jgi:nitroreductase